MDPEEPFAIGTVYSNGEYDLDPSYIGLLLPTSLRIRQTRKTKNERRKIAERTKPRRKRVCKRDIGEAVEETQAPSVGEF